MRDGAGAKHLNAAAAVSPVRSPPARLATSTGWSPPSDASGGSLSENVSGMMSAGLSDTVGGLKEVFKEKLSGVLSPTGYAEALRAYRESIEPFNGWIARNTFTLTARATPDWQSFSKKLGPPGTIIEDVSLWSTAVSAVLLRMKQMHEELDLVVRATTRSPRGGPQHAMRTRTRLEWWRALVGAADDCGARLARRGDRMCARPSEDVRGDWRLHRCASPRGV